MKRTIGFGSASRRSKSKSGRMRKPLPRQKKPTPTPQLQMPPPLTPKLLPAARNLVQVEAARMVRKMTTRMAPLQARQRAATPRLSWTRPASWK